jgi:hypothetical protein
LVISIVFKGNTVARPYRIAGRIHLAGPLLEPPERLALAQMGWRSAEAELAPRSKVASGLPLVPFQPFTTALSLAAENPES